MSNMVFFTEEGAVYEVKDHCISGGDITTPLHYVSGTGKVFFGEPAQFKLIDGSYFTTKYAVTKVMAH